MALHIECDMCGYVLKEPGGLLFGPPDPQGLSSKTHLCEICYTHIIYVIIEGPNA